MEALFEIVPRSPQVSSPLLLQRPRIKEEYLLGPGPSMEHEKRGLTPPFLIKVLRFRKRSQTPHLGCEVASTSRE